MAESIATTGISRRKATAIAMAFQYASLVVLLVRGVIMVPIMARFVDHDVLGAWYASGNVLAWLMVSEGGVWLLLRQQAAQAYGRNDKAELAAVIGAGSALLLLLAVVIAIASFLLAGFVPALLDIVGPQAESLSLAFAFAGFGMALSLPAAIPRAIEHGLQRQFSVNVVQLVAEAASLALTAVLLFKGYGVLALGIGILAREILHNVGNWAILTTTLRRMQISPRFSVNQCRLMFGKTSWVFLGNVGKSLYSQADAIVVSRILGNEAVLVTEWTKRLWEMVSSLALKGTAAFSPAMSHLHGEGGLSRFREIAAALLQATSVAGGVTLATGLALNESFMKVWLGTVFYAGSAFNIAMGAATVSAMLLFTVGEVLFSLGQVRVPAIAQISQTVVRVCSLVILVERLGIIGVPLSMLISTIFGGGVNLVLEWARSMNFREKERYGQVATLAKAILAASIVAFAWRYIPAPDSWPLLGLHGTAIGLSVVLMLYLTDLFVNARLKGLGQHFHKWLVSSKVK